jgi:hypothetical protein
VVLKLCPRAQVTQKCEYTPPPPQFLCGCDCAAHAAVQGACASINFPAAVPTWDLRAKSYTYSNPYTYGYKVQRTASSITTAVLEKPRFQLTRIHNTVRQYIYRVYRHENTMFGLNDDRLDVSRNQARSESCENADHANGISCVF